MGFDISEVGLRSEITPSPFGKLRALPGIFNLKRNTPSAFGHSPQGGENSEVVEIQIIVGFFSPSRGDAAQQQRGVPIL